jgi:RNA polymerase sigma-70 factor (ECF subfamily)
MDRELVDRARRGDRAAMGELFERHRALAYSVGLSILGNPADADEVVQETFLRAFRKLGEWRGEGRLSTWLYTIASRVSLDLARNKNAPTGLLRGEREGVGGDEVERLLAAIRELPEQQRVTIILRHFRAMPIADIAEAQGCAEGTVKANLHWAILRLREILAPELA